MVAKTREISRRCIEGEVVFISFIHAFNQSSFLHRCNLTFPSIVLLYYCTVPAQYIQQSRVYYATFSSPTRIKCVEQPRHRKNIHLPPPPSARTPPSTNRGLSELAPSHGAINLAPKNTADENTPQTDRMAS